MDSTAILYELIVIDPKGNAGEIAGVFVGVLLHRNTPPCPMVPTIKKHVTPPTLRMTG